MRVAGTVGKGGGMGQEWFKKGGWCGVLGAVEGSPGIPVPPTKPVSVAILEIVGGGLRPRFVKLLEGTRIRAWH